MEFSPFFLTWDFWLCNISGCVIFMYPGNIQRPFLMDLTWGKGGSRLWWVEARAAAVYSMLPPPAKNSPAPDVSSAKTAGHKTVEV